MDFKPEVCIQLESSTSILCDLQESTGSTEKDFTKSHHKTQGNQLGLLHAQQSEHVYSLSISEREGVYYVAFIVYILTAQNLLLRSIL